MTDGAGPLSIGDPGRAASEVGPGLPSRYPDSADHELTACGVPGAQVRAASIRGVMHRHRNQPRQDRYSIVYDEPTSTLVVTVCDGVGSLALSQEAASYVTLHAPREYLARRKWPETIYAVNAGLTLFAESASKRERLDQPPEYPNMATTFVAVAINLHPDHRTASVAWTDDSAVWSLVDGAWTKLTADDQVNGSGLHSGGVRALPHRNPRVRVVEAPVHGGALFVMTDGVDVPMAGAKQVRDTLATWWPAPPDVFTFGQQVGFARKSHMDDRTVVGIWFESS